MANIVMANQSKSLRGVDGSIAPRVVGFLEKLQDDDKASGLHIEPMKGAADRRVRTGRVDLNHRAVLFRVDPNEGGTTYVYMGTWPHDEANSIAERAVLRVNPVNGILEGILTETAAATAPTPQATPTGAVAETGPGCLAEFGFTLDILTDQIGIDPGIAERALAAPDDFALNTVAADIGGWQGEALLELACGTAVGDIREKYRFTETPIDTTVDEDDRIIEALDRPASKIQFTYVDGHEELRRVIEGGDFAAWRVFLHPEQRTYAEKDYNGPFRLSGGAGTGKTVVAIHRARNLLRRNPDARIILTTYNKTLAKNLESDLRALDPELEIATRPGQRGIYVAGIDKLANDIVKLADDIGPATEAVLGSRTEMSTVRTKQDRMWREVVESAGGGLDPRLSTPWFLDNEYISVILANKITTLEQYARIARPGRGVRLSRPQRIAVWKLVEAYRRRSRMDDTFSFPEVLAVAAEYLRQQANSGADHIADHVIVDEAQDLHATHWRMLRASVAEGPNDLFIAEDSHQRIYGQPVVLGRLGIKIVGRSRRLTLNYRTTAQNLHLAMSILDGAEYHDLEEAEESTRNYRSARNGPAPQLRHYDSAADELQAVADQINAWLPPGSDEDPSTVAVLTRVKNDRDRMVRGLADRGVKARALDDNPPVPGYVQVMTMHRSKGMEFSRVILAGIDEAHVPSRAGLNGVPEEERGEADLRERSLLYVAASRARDEVVVTWSGEASELLGRYSG
ncbi:3'-5' exonuclease [Nocardia cyriacigeorgica]|uniref:3'-5' exonuclease n=1 Tax=Nocardia cyriacigeorgica TaxID=135487 RepID=UPI001894C669|nr:3'-5' exonuclease [Nocardia cyriacigeorgica]MBF6455554.1 DEAD/DEAH box helicase [Nocardia cyriacigeorgica]MBF6477411.1 DEAD/DEAH box helicase [Nocardia cyriacigeorgica]MBF6553704.1 DEAD/DEAH box helicase [Nocardia cyriacigeorgica]